MIRISEIAFRLPMLAPWLRESQEFSSPPSAEAIPGRARAVVLEEVVKLSIQD